MTKATHIIRFIANEDNRVHLGQLVDTTRDIGLDSVDGKTIEAYLINGTIFDADVADHVYTVKQLLSPVTPEDCFYIRGLGLNYRDHAEEASLPLPKAPVQFCKPRTAITDPYPTAVTIPKAAQDGSSDYEGELCVVMGKTGRDIPEDKALDYVLGYTCTNDVSARILQILTPQWSFGKGMDGSCPLGPVLVTKEAIPDPHNLKLRTIYNGQTVQEGNTKNMYFSIAKIISYLSQGTTIEAGSIFLTGTPAGIGYFREPRIVLEDGGDIRVEIESIGTLVNKVKYEKW